MPIKNLFSTPIYQGKLAGYSKLNAKLLRDIREISKDDKMGLDWSKENYRGGYTSYASLNNMHHRTPAFMEFEKAMAPHAAKFAKELKWNLKDSNLEMTDCWANIMPKNVYHALHFHPHSVLSGTYYIKVPRGSAPLKLEDPRMNFFMNAPLGKNLYEYIEAKEGEFVLFESWLRHEVPPNTSSSDRIGISFNYEIA